MVEFRPVHPSDFTVARGEYVDEHPDVAHFLTPYSAAAIRKRSAQAFLTDNERAGFLLFPDGEIANLFSSDPGRGEEGLVEAIVRGGDRVEFFDEMHLWKLYGAYGFVEVDRYPFDDALMIADFPEYDFEKHGRPEYVIAHRNAEAYVRAKREEAYARGHALKREGNEAIAEAIKWTEKLRDLIGPARDTRTAQQRLTEGW